MMEYISQLWAEFYAAINSIEINPASAIFRLGLSLVLGCVVGFERKRKGQIAGVRTFALIAMGATLAMLISIYVPQEYMEAKSGDPGRIAAQVVTGIGFLGAGAIIHMKGSVKGLTTAAGIWIVAAIGLTVGVGLYLLAITATLLILFILVPLEKLEHKIKIGAEIRVITIGVSQVIENMDPYRQVLNDYGVHLSNVYVDYDYCKQTTVIGLAVRAKDATDYVLLFKALKEVYPTTSISLGHQVNI